MSKYGNTVQDEVNSVSVAYNNLLVNPQLLAACSPLNELSLPIYSNNSTQV
jgi:hypothetical protein